MPIFLKKSARLIKKDGVNEIKLPKYRVEFPLKRHTKKKRKHKRKPPTVLMSLRFEIFGKVYARLLRSTIAHRAEMFKLRGYVKYTKKKRTVSGVIQGRAKEFYKMKQWLKEINVPYARIEKVHLRREHRIKMVYFKRFVYKLH